MTDAVTQFTQMAQNFALTQQGNMVYNATLAKTSWDALSLPVPPNLSLGVPTYYMNFGTAPASPILPGVPQDVPATPTLGAMTVPTFDAAPIFTLSAPIRHLPVTPDDTLPGAPGGAPSFNAPSYPSAPTASLPVAPTMQTLVLPTMPTITVPTFTSTLPVEDIVAPTNVFSYAEQPYQDAMLDALKSKLMSDLLNGGYGIEPTDELTLWQREADREMRLGEAAVQDAARQVAARGFSMPPGALNAFMDQARQSAMEKLSGASRDIAMKRADMYVDNRKFTIQQVKEVEQMLITYLGYMMERALTAAKANVELGIAVYNAQMAKLQYHLDKYRAQAQVYDTILKAALANLEIYKEQVEGAKLSVEAQRVYAELYRTQLDGVQALYGVYRTQMEAAKIQADVEQLKLQAFKTTVDTYTAQVGAKTAQFGMYEAQVRGEMSKVETYQAQASAYGTQVEAYKSKVQAAQAVLEAQIEPNKLLLQKYSADIGAYGSRLQAAQASITSTLGKYEADVKGFAAVVDAQTKAGDLYVSSSKANADVHIAAAKLQGDIATASAGVAVSASNAMGTVDAHLASAYGALAASALSSAQSLTATVASAV